MLGHPCRYTMLAFVVCLIFNAHPDTSLPAEEFLWKRLGTEWGVVLSAIKDMNELAVQMLRDTEPRARASSFESYQRASKVFLRVVTDFEIRRFAKLTRTLANPERLIA